MLKYLRVAWVLSIILHHVWLALWTRSALIKYIYIYIYKRTLTRLLRIRMPGHKYIYTCMQHACNYLQVKSHAKSFRTTIGGTDLSNLLSICCSFGLLANFATLCLFVSIICYRQHTIDFSHGLQPIHLFRSKLLAFVFFFFCVAVYFALFLVLAN